MFCYSRIHGKHGKHVFSQPLHWKSLISRKFNFKKLLCCLSVNENKLYTFQADDEREKKTTTSTLIPWNMFKGGRYTRCTCICFCIVLMTPLCLESHFFTLFQFFRLLHHLPTFRPSNDQWTLIRIPRHLTTPTPTFLQIHRLKHGNEAKVSRFCFWKKKSFLFFFLIFHWTKKAQK